MNNDEKISERVVIVLSSRAVGGIGSLKKESPNLKLTLIIDSSEENEVSPEIRENFDEMHIIQGGDSSGPLISLNVAAVKDKVGEIVLNHGKNNVSVMTFNEFCVELVGKINDEFNLIGPTEEDSHVFRDKDLMKRLLKSKGIRTPHHLMDDHKKFNNSATDYFNEIKKITGLPFIIKPCKSALSFGVCRINSIKDFMNWCHHQRQANTDYDIEEFIDGELYHCDTAILNKKILFCEASQYSCPVMDFADGKPLGSVALSEKSDIRNKIVIFCKKVLSALGNPNGVTHMEVFRNKRGELIFLEVGARPPGGMINDMIEKTFNVNLIDLHLRIHGGLPVADQKTERFNNCFWMFFPRKSGKVIDIQLPKTTSQCAVQLQIEVGQTLKPSQSILDKSGSVIATHENYEELIDDFDAFKESEIIKSSIN